MSPLAHAIAGLVLALGFALPWQRRRATARGVLVVQSLLVAVAALAEGAWPLAVLVFGVGTLALPILPAGVREPVAWPRRLGSLAGAAAILSLVALPLDPVGPGVAVALLGLLLVTAQPAAEGQVAGMAALGNGIVLAGLGRGAGPILLAAPLLPLFALGGTWLRRRPLRDRLPPAFDAACCGLLLLLSCALSWYGTHLPGLRLDSVGIGSAILLSLVAAGLRLPRPRPDDGLPLRGTVLLAGALVALLAAGGALSWIGLAVATAGAAGGAPAGRHRLAAIGLGLTLLGHVILPGAALPGGAALLVGYGCLGALSPEMGALAALLLLRLPGLIGTTLPGAGVLLVLAGLLGLLVGVIGLTDRRPARARFLPALATLAQSGVAACALGLGTPQATFAGVLQVLLLVLTRVALELSPEPGPPRLAALAGMAGVPPFGLFPSLALLLAAAASQAPLLLAPLGLGLGTLGWLLLRSVPTLSGPIRPSLAWLPLAALLLLGFVLPGPVAAGLRLVAGDLR